MNERPKRKSYEEMTQTELVARLRELITEFKRYRFWATWAFLLLFFAATWAIKGNYDRIDDINVERTARTNSAASIIDQNCNINNGQDTLLAGLVAASLAGGGSAGSDFGTGVDPNRLTPFDAQVIQSINRIANASPPPELNERFRATLRKLRDLEDCAALVADYLAGNPIDTDPNLPGVQGLPETSPGE